MIKRTSLFLALAITTATTIPGVAQTEGDILSSDEVPTYVPEQFHQEWHDTKEIPKGWNAAIPIGGAIATSGSGKIEISSLKLMCDVPGKSGKQTIVSDVQSIAAGQYLLDPWFGNNDYHEKATKSTTSDGTITLNVAENRIMHWWTNIRGIVPAGTKNCATEAVIRANSGTVIASVGGNWWKSSTAGWAGLSVNNREMGGGHWYKLSSEWQVVRLNPPN